MEGDFDAVVLGTGLTESITAAALSKAGFKVAHIDINPYYGAEEASLSLDELVQWADLASIESTRYSSLTRSQFVPPQSRQYSVSLSPSVIPAVGPFISSLIGSGVARYGGFRLLERIGIFNRGSIENVPGSKEDVFKNKAIGLVDKRRLMRFLLFSTSEFESKAELQERETLPFIEFLQTVFSLNEEIARTIVYCLAFCSSEQEPTLPALQRIRRYLRSSGRYGSSPFLVGHYGGSGEIAQGFCRTSAVSGGVYILGRRINSITPSPQSTSAEDGTQVAPYTITLEDFPDQVTCDLIVASPRYAASYLGSPIPEASHNTKTKSVARCVAIVDRPTFHQTEENSDTKATPSEVPPLHAFDTQVLVFPPASLNLGSPSDTVTALITGEGAMSTPKGKWVVYLSMLLDDNATNLSPEALLKPYLNTILSLVSGSDSDTESPFYLYYLEHIPLVDPDINGNASSLIITPSSTPLLADSSDSAAGNAEAIFWEAIKRLRSSPRVAHRREDLGEIDTFWPPLQSSDSDDEEW